MRTLKSALAGFLALIAASTAVAQTFPTVPSQSVIGRLGVAGTSGPSQPIPFATLFAQLAGGASAAGLASGKVTVKRVLPPPATYGTATWAAYSPSDALLCSGANGSAALTTCLANAINTAFPYAVATTASGYDFEIVGGDEPSNGAGSNRGGAAGWLALTAPLQLPPIQGGKIRIGAITLTPGLVIDTCEMCDIEAAGAQLVYDGGAPGSIALRLKPTQVTPLDPNFGVSPARIFSTTVVGRTRLDLSGHASANVDYTNLHIVEMNWVTLTGGCAVLVDSPAAGQNMNNNKFNIEQLHGSGAVTTAFCHGTAAPGGGAVLGGSTFNIGIALDSAGATNGFDEWGSNDEIHLKVSGLSTGYALKFESGACKNVAWIWSSSGTATVTDSSGCTGTSANVWHINGTMFIGGASIASSSADVVMANGGLKLGTQSSVQGFIQLNWSGGAAGPIITSASNGGNPTIQTPNSNGTLAVSASSPVVLNAATGNLTCPTCVTSSGGGAITGTAPISVSAAGVVSITSPLPLTNGGTNASLTASNGGIFYSTATAGAILSGTATASLPLLSGSSTTPTWAAITYPASATSGGVAYFSSTTAMASSGLMTLNGVVYGGGAGAAPLSTAQGAANTVLTANAGAPSFSAAPVIGTSVTTPISYGGSAAGSTKLINGTSNGSPASAFLNLQSNGQFVSIGNTSPKAYLDINPNLSSSPALVLSTSTNRVKSADAVDVGTEWVSYGAALGTALVGAAAGGTSASPTATPSGRSFFNLKGYGYTGSAWAQGGIIVIASSELWSGTAQGTNISFYTTPNATTALTNSAVLNASGGLSIGGALTDPGAGGLFVNGATVTLNGLATDATHTDRTVCQDTTSKTLFFGSGALGVCLGTSGAQFKTAFAPMAAGIDELMKIDFQTYRYREGFGDNGARMQYGTTAQSVEAALPDLARRNTSGEVINYDSGALLFIGLRAVQQLKADNDNLRAEVRKMQGAR